MKYQPYNNEPFQRDCEERYGPIYTHCKRYNRPFSVLDLGANYGWFGHRLVQDFDNCVYVGVDNKTIDPHERIYHINRHLTLQELGMWSRSDSFDLVIAYSVLHHFPDYRAAFHCMFRMGEYTFFEVPNRNETKCKNAENAAGINELFRDIPHMAEFTNHLDGARRPLYGIRNFPFIAEQTLDAPQRGAQGYPTYKIASDYDSVRITIDRSPAKSAIEERDWVPGMNLHNYNLLCREGDEITAPTTKGHPDDRPWNYVLSSGGIVPIDEQHGAGR